MTVDSSTKNPIKTNCETSFMFNKSRNAVTSANTSGSSSALLLQKQHSLKPSGVQFSRNDDIEIVEKRNFYNNSERYRQKTVVGWICCAPCIWIQTSATVHKMALTSATLLVTTLLVASPILFLISTAPSPLPRDCYIEGDGCQPSISAPVICSNEICKKIALSIQSYMNWSIDPCYDFKKFSCSNEMDYNEIAPGVIRSAQQSVDIQMQDLFQKKTEISRFKKLYELYESCLRFQKNSSAILNILNQLGGYLPIGSIGPLSIAPLISKMNSLGPSPLVDIYYDLSYGKRPHVLLIINGPGSSTLILEGKIRWTGPKAPQNRVKPGLPKLLNYLLELVLPQDMSSAQKIFTTNVYL